MPDRYPLSYQQQQLWFVDRVQGGSLEYNTIGGLRIDGPLNVDAFILAVRTIVARHDSLRTRFVLGDAGVEQTIDDVDGDVAVDDLSALEPPEQSAQIDAIVAREVRAPFVLSEGALFRARLLKLAADRWVFLRSAHHIVWDGWSSGVYNRELGALYAAYCQGRENPLPSLPIQYPDFARWQRQTQGPTIDDDLAFWRNQLAGYPESLNIPSDRQPGGSETIAAHTWEQRLVPGMALGLVTLARAAGASTHMSLLAVLSLLLARYSGQDDILIGMPSAGRRERAVENLIGLFTNLLAIRLQPRRGSTFTELQLRARDAVFDACEHESAPFEHIVREIAPHRSASRMPLFDVMFTTPGSRWLTPRLQGLTVEPFFPAVLAGHFGIQLNARQTDDGEIHLTWLADAQRFESWRLEQMAGDFVRLLEEAIANPNRDVWSIDYVGPQRGRPAGAADTSEVTTHACIHDLIAAQARRSPEVTAVLCGDVAASYSTLMSRRDALADVLRRSGVKPGSVVGVALPRSIDSIATILAIWHVGGIYLPIEGDSESRSTRILELAGAARVVTSASHAPLFPERLVLAIDAGPSSPNPALQNGVIAAASDLAYVFYTSGSTGEPKGVLVDHGSLAVSLRAAQATLSLKEGDRHLALSAVTFDPSLLDFLLPLIHGATVVIADREQMRDLRLVPDLMTRQRITSAQATPSHWRAIVSRCGNALRGTRLLSGGEPLTRELAAHLVTAGAEVWNVYGPTETTIWCTARRVEASDLAETAPPNVTIGRPLSGYDVRVVDEQGLAVPVGVTGEVLIGGRAVARGYLNATATTDERFIADPLTPGARLFRTGDLACWTRDGGLEFRGRQDDQVKIRGHRVEPGEVEWALRTDESIADATVVFRGDGALGSRLIGYVVPKVDVLHDGDAIRRRLARLIPEYMMPASMIVVDRIPLTPHGKVDRAALPNPGTASTTNTGDSATTPTETALCQIFAAALGCPSVGRDDNFFELGGHSLLLLEVAGEIAAVLHVEIPLGVLFDAPTVKECATWIEQAAGLSRV